MTPTLRGATALHLLRARGRMTTGELAQELGCHRVTALRVLNRLELSRRFVLIYQRPHWSLLENDAETVTMACYSE